MEIKKGDAVKIIAGSDKGSTGTVLAVSRATNKIVVEGVNIVNKHQRARKADEKSGIVSEPAPFDASNAMVICPVCLKATRISHQGSGKEKARYCKQCGAKIDGVQNAKKTVKKTRKTAAKKKADDVESND